jgi:two-component system nitrogen regulation sensor histidine kinase GlnL
MKDPRPPSGSVLNQILDNLSTAVLLLDGELRLRYVNSAAEVLFAASARHLLGQQASALIQCEGGRVRANLRRALDSGEPFTEREIQLALPEGREVTVDCTVLPLRGLEGGGSRLLVEIQQVDRQLRMSREEQLLLQHQASRDVVRRLAHEIKNPLGGLRGAAQLLQGELAEEGLREYTQVIIAEADRLQALVNRMLGPNKLPAYRSTNIHQILERVRQLIAAESGPGIAVVRDYDPSIPDITADADQLIQALLNIARNAARAVAGAGTITLRTRVQRQFTIGGIRHRLVARIQVIDDGPGIPPELIEKIFYPMVSGTEDGMGLGLSIAQSLINQHGGLVECRSRPGETAFTVLLPVERHNGPTQ